MPSICVVLFEVSIVFKVQYSTIKHCCVDITRALPGLLTEGAVPNDSPYTTTTCSITYPILQCYKALVTHSAVFYK